MGVSSPARILLPRATALCAAILVVGGVSACSNSGESDRTASESIAIDNALAYLPAIVGGVLPAGNQPTGSAIVQLPAARTLQEAMHIAANRLSFYDVPAAVRQGLVTDCAATSHTCDFSQIVLGSGVRLQIHAVGSLDGATPQIKWTVNIAG